jgi:hypothetical protein
MGRELKTAGNPANADKTDMWRPQAVSPFIFNDRGGSIPQKEAQPWEKLHGIRADFPVSFSNLDTALPHPIAN